MMTIRRLLIAISIGAIVIVVGSDAQTQASREAHPIRIVIHGGAGTILKSSMTPETEKQIRAALTEALMSGYTVLKNHGKSLDAVVAAIRVMEDSPLFNAGKGAVFTHEGTNEMDAAIMDGKAMKAGAVAAVKHIKNPIALARLVMDRSPHVMLVGDGAEAFAKENGVTLVPAKYFYTERRWKELQRILEEEKKKEGGKDKSAADSAGEKHGTVGCVALDEEGNLAAGTSTGGLTNKRFGRIGDSPIIGAGTYANNLTCAVSATGTGEYFIRWTVAHDISALMEYAHLGVKAAADSVVMGNVTRAGGDGGVIALDKNGNFAMPFNTSGMYRAYIDDQGNPVVELYKE